MEPLPETIEAIEDLGPFADYDLLSELLDRSDRVMEVVPDCVGLSLASTTHGVTLTLVATEQQIVVLDALQHEFAGPGLVAVHAPQVIECEIDDVLHEGRWRRFAHATAATAVASTLTMPILVGGKAVGSISLYAASANGFTGLHEDIARIFDAWAPGAVTNADLPFSSREDAKRAPRVLREELNIHLAVGILAATDRLGLDEAREGLSAAARQALVSEADLAATIIAGYRDRGGD